MLEQRGWQMCETEPGLFRKGEMMLTVYVDDSLISGPCDQEIKKEMNSILEYFEGKEVEPDFDLAVRRHRLLDTIQFSADRGKKETV